MSNWVEINAENFPKMSRKQLRRFKKLKKNRMTRRILKTDSHGKLCDVTEDLALAEIRYG